MTLGWSSTEINQGLGQRLSFITFGAKDFFQLKQFYFNKFKWTPLKENGSIAFFKMNGFILGLYPDKDLATDAGIPEIGSGFKKFTLSVNYKSEKEVDETFAAMRENGVEIIKAPKKTSWGG